jgi:hypothetical protein
VKRSLSALFLVAWALVVVPALCVAGVLAHGCACEDEVACAHETDCDVDPCSELVARTDESADLLGADPGLALGASPIGEPGSTELPSRGMLTPPPRAPRPAPAQRNSPLRL